MKVRGRRECKQCGTRWAYYETGSVACPACGSVESVGVGERALHTASPAELDLTAVRARIEDDPLGEVTDAAKSTCREYLRKQGFIESGDLQPLDDRYLLARELVEVADVVGRALTPGDDEEAYLLALLAGADDGDRPDPGAVPERLRAARGLAVTRAVDDYLGDVRDWLDENPHEEAQPLLERVDDHVRRVRALQGDVPPAESERLATAARELGTYLRTGEESAFGAANGRLDELA